ncbi:MAG: alcohol dehydrogenase catalytic domain-containing protein [Armatimonadota bacterium]|nr:alcohol dehydrogenase catalytic domain-containing protein [Armatimonadota bacterium]
MKMVAAVLHSFNDLRLEEVPVPEMQEPDDVLVRVRACGICATDYKAIKGIRTNVSFPSIQGHEISGQVAAVGSGVRYFREGDPVIVQPLGHCGICTDCRTGNTHYCRNSFVLGGDGPPDVRNGGFAEYVLTKEHTLYRKPANITFDEAAITEPLAGAWKGVIRHSEMRLGDDVVVIGTGSIGSLCVAVARSAGAARLVAVDTSDYALNKAVEFGATHTVNCAKENAKSRIYEILPEGPDLVVEAAGSIEAVRLMVSLLRRGTRWNVFGITTHEKFELDGGLTHFLEARMDSSFGTTTEAMVRAIKLLEAGLVDIGKLITHRFPLAQIHDAIKLMESPNRCKIVVNP